MRPRLRGCGCLGCLPLGGMMIFGLPVLLVVALVYFLVNRRPPAPVQPGAFCPQCGKPLDPGARFCTGCGAHLP
jgi:hypothetical protein